MDARRTDGSHALPATFAERGVAVPFTAPGLLGTRVRRGAPGLELVFANPSGGRGTYVVPWSGVPDLVQTTVHDLQLIAALDGLAEITPATVQAAARRVAIGGAAGRAARAAALTAEAADRARQQAALRLLLSALVAEGAPAPDVQRVAALAACLAPLGLPGSADADAAPIPCAIASAFALRDALLGWAATNPEAAPVARLVASLADACATAAERAVREARHDSPAALARAWAAGADRVTSLAARAAWLLDGWHVPAMVWQTNPGGAALAELGALTPCLPEEAASWAGLDPGAALTLRRLLAQRQAEHGPERRGGDHWPDLVSRNERLRCIAA